MLANGGLPSLILLEDALDLVDFYEVTGRTVLRHKWAVESIAMAQRQMMERMF